MTNENPKVSTRPSTADGRTAQRRLAVIDLLRGLVIVLMVLDHVRDYFHEDAFAFDPTNLAQTTPALFMTRWITHLCAPTFVFLSGVSAFLQREAAGARLPVARFLVTRGLWLIALELTVIVLGFHFAWPFLFLQVIWAIGVGMVLLAALSWLPARAVLALGGLIVVGPQLLGPIDAAQLGSAHLLWNLLFEPGDLAPLAGFIIYPAVPWFGVMALGYGLGSVFLQPAQARNRSLSVLGGGALVAFVIVRALNGYGDPQPWSVQSNGVFTALSFINVSKYPPSLDYVLATLGVTLSLAPLVERLRGPMADLLLAVGSTPLFTYLVHIYLAHGLAVLVGLVVGISPAAFTHFLSEGKALEQAHWGFSLGVVYFVWIVIVASLWPLAHWYGAVKRRRPHGWLRYL